jgi:hypothetical protein
MSSSSDNSLLTNQLPVSLDVNPQDRDFESILLLYLRRVANAVNTKESGLFLLQETGSFEQWYQLNNPQQNRNGYRLTIDLVALNGGNPIPASTTTTLPLNTTTQPPAIIGYQYPVQGFGGAIANGVSYFLNDHDVYVRFNGSTNMITIVNNLGNTLTWCVYVLEYLKQ